MKFLIQKKQRIFPITVIVAVLLNCASVQQLIKIQKPAVSLDELRLTSLTFTDAGLELRLKISNPNQLAVTLAGFDYELLLNGSSFIKGKRDTTQTIRASGDTFLSIPFILNFRNVYQTVQGLKNRDSTGYQVKCGLLFELPILGQTRIPFNTDGSLPLPKLPRLKIQDIRVKKLNFTGADLELSIGVSNPNSFMVILNQLDYDFSVAGQSWARGISSQLPALDRKQQNTIFLPISLNFAGMGQTALKLLTGNAALNYKFTGSLDFGTSLNLLNRINLPVEKSGSLNLKK